MMKYLPVLFLWLMCVVVDAQEPSQVEDSELIFLGTTEPLRERFKPLSDALENSISTNGEWKAVDQKALPPYEGPSNPNALPAGEDPLRQGLLRNDNAVFPIMQVEGLEFRTSLPGDPTGDIGANYYIQMTNGTARGSQILFLNKRGDVVAGPSDSETLFWEQFGVDGQGDPIVVYDEHAERWLLTEFAPPGDNMLLLAVSATSDPLGRYHTYIFNTPNFPDYPKFGVWPGAYTVSTNEVGGSVPVYALERDSMLEGRPARLQRFTASKYDVNFGGQFVWQVPTVADWDGDLAPDPGAPAIFMRIYDDSWNGGQDRLDLYEFEIDWDNPGNSGVGPRQEIITAPFESDVCEDGLFTCIFNPNGQEMAALQQVIMNRLQYRRFPTHETIVGCFTMDANGENLAGIRWFELRKLPGQSWELYQEGTFSPDDTHRFMGSIAMDAEGNIALGYSTVSSTSNPALRYTGRRNGDPLGMMTIDEYEFALSSVANDNVRWGDYSSMNVDPIDQTSFWYTGQYRTESPWRTSIVNFSLEQRGTDIKPLTLEEPSLNLFYSASESVAVFVQNRGVDTITTYSVEVHFGDQIHLDTIVQGVQLHPGKNQLMRFSDRVDLSSFPSQEEIMVIVTTPGDAYQRNDTLKLIYSGDVNGLIGMEDLRLDEFINCATEGTVTVEVSNIALRPLQSMLVGYRVNGGPLSTTLWEGFVGSGNTKDIFIQVEGLQEGLNTLQLYAIEYNELQAIRSDTISAEVELSFDKERVVFELQLDSFPGETRWFLRDPVSGAPYINDGPFETPLENMVVNFCLDPDCYRLSIFDSGDNGLCCDFGEGYYRVFDPETDTVFVSGASFGGLESQEFCVPFSCQVEISDTIVEDASAMGVADGSILVTSINGAQPFEYSIDGGVFGSNAFFDSLAPNQFYNIVLRDQNGCLDSVEVFIDAPVNTQSAPEIAVGLSILPNPTDGVFHAQLEGELQEFRQPYKIWNTAGYLVEEGHLVRYGDRWLQQISLGDHPRGTYIMRVYSDFGAVMARIVVY